MIHSSIRETRRLTSFSKMNLKKWRNVFKKRPDLIQRLLFVLLAAICGLLLASAHYIPLTILPVSSTKTSSTESTQAATPAVSTPVTTGPTQTNPLFASTPSWAQDYSTKTSGVPDPLYWNTLVGPAENSNKEQQYYTADNTNLHIANGALSLISTKQNEPDGYSYGSARLETQNKQSFLYGRIDVTAKLPKGVGTWPAIWLLPATNTYRDKSPASDALRYKNGGEIDLMESVGYQPNLIYGVAHTASDATTHPDGTGSYATKVVSNSTSAFNTYTVLWTPTSITFEVNGEAYYTYARPSGADYKTWPFDQPFYMIINLALGGTWGGSDTAAFPGNGIDNSSLPASLDIQSIYYYKYVGSTALN